MTAETKDAGCKGQSLWKKVGLSNFVSIERSFFIGEIVFPQKQTAPDCYLTSGKRHSSTNSTSTTPSPIFTNLRGNDETNFRPGRTHRYLVPHKMYEKTTSESVIALFQKRAFLQFVYFTSLYVYITKMLP